MLEIDLTPAALVERPRCAGGSHDTDWWCPECERFNSTKRRSSAKCAKVPGNGRHSRAWFRGRAKDHETAAVLRKHGLLRALRFLQ
jgi:hypothetical protein